MRQFLVQCVFATALTMGWSSVGYSHDLSSSLPPVLAASEEPRSVTLFQNVRIFSGKGSELSGPSHVLVRGNQIEKISTQPIPTDRRGDTVIIDGAGRTLMPGLIDAHTHMMFANLPQMVLMTSDITYSAVVAAKGANEMLLRGFTSGRDVGGPIFGLKRAIDQGIISGPRIWPSGATISQTAGHGDFRLPTDFPSRPGDHSFAERVNATAIADGVPAVLQRTREQLAMGASQIKVMAGGGRCGGQLGHLCDRSCLHAQRSPTSGRSRGQVYRAWSVARRSDGQVPCGKRDLAQPAALLAGEGCHHLRQPSQRRQVRTNGDRHRPGLQMGQATQGQGGFWYRCPVRCEFSGAPRRPTGQAHPLVHTRRSADHGDFNQRGIIGVGRPTESVSREIGRG